MLPFFSADITILQCWCYHSSVLMLPFFSADVTILQCWCYHSSVLMLPFFNAEATAHLGRKYPDAMHQLYAVVLEGWGVTLSRRTLIAGDCKAAAIVPCWCGTDSPAGWWGGGLQPPIYRYCPPPSPQSKGNPGPTQPCLLASKGNIDTVFLILRISGAHTQVLDSLFVSTVQVDF
jgi:hypothetical protein